jgi:hypothetical protein
MAEQQIPGVSFIRVTNGLNEKVAGRYDGTDYLWKPGDAHDIPIAAAEHIFGFGVEDKSQAMNRLGWMPSSDKHDAAFEKLSMIQFDVVEQVFQLPKRKAKRLSNARSPVNAEGATGGVVDETPSSPPADPPEQEEDDPDFEVI